MRRTEVAANEDVDVVRSRSTRTVKRAYMGIVPWNVAVAFGVAGIMGLETDIDELC